MILSQWKLTADEYYSVCNDDRYRMHQALCNVFDCSKVRFDLVKRNNLAIISTITENSEKISPILGDFKSKEYAINPSVGSLFRCECDVNLVISHSTPEHKNPKKIPVVGQNAVESWLLQRADMFGGNIDSVLVSPTERYYHLKKGGNIAWHHIEFYFRVTDSEKFRIFLHEGIGKARHLGFGLVKAFLVR